MEKIISRARRDTKLIGGREAGPPIVVRGELRSQRVGGPKAAADQLAGAEPTAARRFALRAASTHLERSAHLAPH